MMLMTPYKKNWREGGDKLFMNENGILPLEIIYFTATFNKQIETAEYEQTFWFMVETKSS